MSIDQFLFISISLIPFFGKTEIENETFPFIPSWDSPWERILEISYEKIWKMTKIDISAIYNIFKSVTHKLWATEII